MSSTNSINPGGTPVIYENHLLTNQHHQDPLIGQHVDEFGNALVGYEERPVEYQAQDVEQDPNAVVIPNEKSDRSHQSPKKEQQSKRLCVS